MTALFENPAAPPEVASGLLILPKKFDVPETLAKYKRLSGPITISPYVPPVVTFEADDVFVFHCFIPVAGNPETYNFSPSGDHSEP